MRARLMIALLLALLAAGCNGTPPRPRPTTHDGGLEPPEPDEEQTEEAPSAHDEEEEGSRWRRLAAANVLPSLLPIDAREVQWFELTREEHVSEAALFVAEGRAGRAFLDSAGLRPPGAADADAGLRVWRTSEEIWVFPNDALGPDVGRAPYRAWAPEVTWTDAGDARGRRGAAERIETRAGGWRCVRTDHVRGDVVIRHAFAPERGLVRLEVVVRQTTRLRLDLVDVARRGAPEGGYDASTPEALWTSLRAAVRGADVEGFERLIDPALRRRARQGGGDDPVADVVRARLNEVIALELQVKSAWRVAGEEAAASATMAVPREGQDLPTTTRCEVVAARAEDGTWRWAGVRTGEGAGR